MKIYTLNNKQEEDLLETLAQGIVLSTETITRRDILKKFKISEKTYDYIIPRLVNYKIEQAKAHNKIKKDIGTELAERCYNDHIIPALYVDNKDIFKETIKFIKENLISKFRK